MGPLILHDYSIKRTIKHRDDLARIVANNEMLKSMSQVPQFT